MSAHYSRIAGNIYRNDETGEDFVASLDVLLPQLAHLRADLENVNDANEILLEERDSLVEQARIVSKMLVDKDEELARLKHEDLYKLLVDARASNASLREALEMAKNGLEWWKQQYPLAVEECDHDALKEIAAVLNATAKREVPDTMITCSKCGLYHSIYDTECPPF
jgi:hypothetical protein